MFLFGCLHFFFLHVCLLGVFTTLLCCSQGYEVHVFDSLINQTLYLGNTTDTYFRISSLLAGHNYTFSVQARCLVGAQLCGEPALLLYNPPKGTDDHLKTVHIHSD